MSEKKQCKACRRSGVKVDFRDLCTHCADKIDVADSKASDINGIREDMRAFGIPTGKYSKTYQNDGVEWVDLNIEEEIDEYGN